MRVIQIMDNFSVGGGVNSFVYDLCYALKEQGCDISLIGILNKGYDQNPEIEKLRSHGIRVECVGASDKKDALIYNVSTLRKYIKNIAGGEVTVCNLHLKLSVLMGVLATVGLKNVKCVETYHNTYHHYHLQCWICGPFIKKYIAVSQTAGEEMHRRFYIPYKKIEVIPNGVSRNKIRKLAKIDEYRPENGRIHIVSVGRLSYEKNFITPVKAFVNLCNENLTYTLVGGGAQANKIQAVATKNPYINMMGPLSREASLQELAKADIVIMPSLWEGRSILQLEAMALDKPMIISDVPGLREPFKEKELEKNKRFKECKFGYVVSVNDEYAYRNAVLNFCNKKDKYEISEYVKSVSLRNDISRIAKKYIVVYLNKT